ncbi:SLBB domain-containing protein, partial [Moorena sp. SIO4A5]|uniref:SLBB domain-containing protein n=1 Tax=Moorena sp. SIO4A5 TaxID=2607838 RepID=UPI0025E37A0C
ERIVARSLGSDLIKMPWETVEPAPVKVPKKPPAEMIASIPKVKQPSKSKVLAKANTTNRPVMKLTFSSDLRLVNGSFFEISNQPEDDVELIVADANLTAPGKLAMLTFRELLPPHGEQPRDNFPVVTVATSTIAQSTPTPSQGQSSSGQSTDMVPLPTFEQPTQPLPSPPGQPTDIQPLPTFEEPIETIPFPSLPNLTTPAPPVESFSPVIDQSYTLGAGDVILITIFRVPEFSGQQQVGVDGSLKLPLVGKLTVEGMTLEEAEFAIATKYQSELRSPAITVSLLQARPLQIAISGEIKKPGSYVLPLINNTQFPSIAQAVQLAGGMTQSADLEAIQIRRTQPSGITDTIRVNLSQLLQAGDLSQNLILRDGDVIMIPTTTEVDLTKTAQLAASNLASTDAISDVAVVGEVFRPGAYRLGGGENGASRPTVSQAIQTAGGIKPSANVRQIQVRRPTRDGTEQLINVNLWKLLQEGDLSQDLALQKGDTVIIPTVTEITAAEAAQIASTNLSPNVIRVNVSGEVKQPGTVEMPSNTTLNEALLSVGGFNERSEEVVELIRFNLDGSLTRREIQVNLKQGLNDETNPLLWNNDIILAGRSRSARITDTLSNILSPILQILSPLRLLF